MLLANPVGPVGGLVFDGRVPPGVIVNDHVCASEVEAGAASLQGDEEDRFFTAVEGVYKPQALLGGGGAVEVEAVDAFLGQMLADEIQHACELGEQQHPMAAFQSVLQQLVQEVQLAAAAVIIIKKERRMAAELTQACEERQNFDTALFEALGGELFLHFLPGFSQPGGINLALARCHFGAHFAFHFRRQFFEHFFFQTSQQEGTDMAAQVLQRFLVLIFDNRRFKVILEKFVAAQVTRQNEIKDRPQFGKGIFHRRACEGKAHLGGNVFGRLGCLGAWVFDMLRFVKNGAIKVEFLVIFDVPAQYAVRCDEKIRIR